MTFHAVKNPDMLGRKIDVHVTSGSVAVRVTEDVGHLRAFHHELGQLLDQFDPNNRNYMGKNVIAQDELISNGHPIHNPNP
jgi:hypothetical protein